MNLKNLSNQELVHETKQAVVEERKITLKVLHLLRELQERKAYLDLGYSSLFDFAVQGLGYSESAAQRRISSMRALCEIPELEEKVKEGRLSLSTISQAQSFLRQEAKLEKRYTREEKLDLFEHLEAKSSREVTQALIQISPESVTQVQEKRRLIAVDKTELRVVLDQALIEKLDRIKALLSHSNPNMSDRELITVLADRVLKQIDPLPMSEVKRPKARKASLPAKRPKATKLTRYIPRPTRRAVWTRDAGQCSYRDAKSSRRCTATHFVQIDHVKPWSLGGDHNIENLRLLCAQHNRVRDVRCAEF